MKKQKSKSQSIRQSNDQITSNNQETYPAADVLFDVIKDEYEKERDRSNSIDSKANIFIGAIIAALAIFIPNIPYADIKIFLIKSDKLGFLLMGIILCCLAAAIILTIISFYELFQAFKVQDFKRPNIDSLNDEDILKASEKNAKRGLIDHYHTIVKYNEDKNTNKANYLQKGIGLAVVSFLIMILITIIINFVVH